MIKIDIDRSDLDAHGEVTIGGSYYDIIAETTHAVIAIVDDLAENHPDAPYTRADYIELITDTAKRVAEEFWGEEHEGEGQHDRTH